MDTTVSGFSVSCSVFHESGALKLKAGSVSDASNSVRARYVSVVGGDQQS